ncbi:tRNA pseudouridine(55) synthase TruB [Azospirillum picis]|uniref:tRNA pseudouridine synthase B n=1 Tax=Azospirillum picis TaxID=488438 RepID=A0ABU0MKZ5_9PROT|nr:tRNA pseudouridine(55) synthase TruB [Azospirillum picis]MBP2300348.1 tRNA pseudouridine55 synthase [Azospirillum picis]MDQ0534144.1 tRNA pseudouridine55 synthase [Azospirillum picis]
MARKRKGTPIHGWVVLDKPEGVTSTQALSRVRRLLNAEKAGHGGTLDPLATGILPIALGEATKTVSYAMDGSKTYRFSVRWGERTSTDDREGEVIDRSDLRPSTEAIRAALPAFLGEIDQVPPQFCAIKVGGERAYDIAREGDAVDLAARTVRIDRFELVEQPDADHAVFEVDCGKGTYVRSLARDLAEALGTVGHVALLRRLRVGSFTLDRAISLDELAAMEQGAAVERLLLPIETALDDIPALALTEAEAHRLRHGQTVALLTRQDRDRLMAVQGPDGGDRTVIALFGGTPVALARVEGAEVRPVRVLNL